jgi:hypothetical protein
MNHLKQNYLCGLRLVIVFCSLAVFLQPQQSIAAGALHLLPHRAVYEISLAQGGGRNSLISAGGKLSYEFTGNACEGYSTKTRFLTNLQSHDGATQVTDMTSATFESGDGKEMRFLTASKLNGKLSDFADGMAQIADDGALKVMLKKPKKESLSFGSGILFPSQHTLALLDNARKGESVVRADLFDGSESGKKFYATTAILGKEISGAIPTDHPAARFQKTARYPIALSFFDQPSSKAGEQIELYTIHSVMFENGVTYAMRLDYPEFSFEAKMILLQTLPESACP